VDPQEAEALKLYNEAIAKGINPAEIGNDAGDLVSGTEKKSKVESEPKEKKFKVESEPKEKVDSKIDDSPASKKESEKSETDTKEVKKEKNKPKSINSGLEEDAINFLHEESNKTHAAAKDAEAL
jgi:hypothetical protein